MRHLSLAPGGTPEASDRTLQKVDERIARLRQLVAEQEANYYRDHNIPRRRSSSNTSVEQPMLVRKDAVGFRACRYTTSCRSTCPCACHKRRTASTPALMDRVLGQVFVGYSGVPLLASKCSDHRCKQPNVTQIDLEYWFPMGYFWSRVLRVQFSYQASLGPQLQLSTLRRVPDGAQCVEYALAGNIPGLKHLFEQGLASPRDIDAARGYSLLRVRICCMPSFVVLTLEPVGDVCRALRSRQVSGISGS